MSEVECPTCSRTDFKSETGMKTHHARTHGESLNEEERSCENCGEEFVYRNYASSEGRFCSKKCWSVYQNDKKRVAVIDYECNYCGKEFSHKEWSSRKGKYCSIECNAKDWEENDEHFMNDEIAEKIADTRRGSDNPNWKGGVTLPYPSGFRTRKTKVRERDSYECQVCGMSQKEHQNNFDAKLEVHHIVPRRLFLRCGEYLEGVNCMENLVTVCKVCHNKVEHMTGPKTVRVEPFSVMEPYRRAQE